MIRFFDLLFSLIGIVLFLPIMTLIWLIIWFNSGSPLFKQLRVGFRKKSFTLLKFRTMKLNTSSVATHLVKNNAITPVGRLLRITKIDELPQLWNVLIGEMSLVGPRPCLLNQNKLIFERNKRGLFKFRPGITGLAQIRGITMKKPTLLAKTDQKMMNKMNLYFYFYYIFITLILIFNIKK